MRRASGRVAGLAVAGLAVASLMGCATTSAATRAEPVLQWRDAKLIAEALDRLAAEYVDPVDSHALARNALKGMLEGLDPWSTYLTPEEYAALESFDDTSATAAPGADAGSTVAVFLPRPGYARLVVASLHRRTPEVLAARIAALGPLKGAVLDLRGNPGGIFTAGADLADLFLEHGVLLRAEGRAPDATFTREAAPGDVLGGAPLIVLVDGATASAAEIAAGALHDNGRALVFGARTFGKGSVQSVIPLRSGGAIKFTTARYRRPSGALIDGAGIEPDVPVAALDATGLAPDADLALERALDALAVVKR